MQTNQIFVFGSYNVDMVSIVEEFPQPGQTLKALSFSIGSGGKGANQAYAAHQNGGKVCFLTKLGDDAFYSYGQQALLSRGLHKCYINKAQECNTGVASIFVRDRDKENLITVNLGANEAVSPADIEPFNAEIAKSSLLLVQLENSVEAILASLKIAKRNSVLTVLNPAPYTASCLQLLPYVDIITPNASEAALLVGMDTIENFEQAQQAAELIEQRFAISKVVITLGSSGALCYCAGHSQFVEAERVTVRDTTGAGDAFNGALVAALAAGEDLHTGVKKASHYASLAVQGAGAAAMPKWQLD